MNKFPKRRLALTFSALIGAHVTAANAADGYFMIGTGPRAKALGGAGVAYQTDAMALSVNPAGIVGLERQFQLGMTIVNADRGYYTEGRTVVVAPGNVESGRAWFPVPNGGYVAPIDGDSAWSINAYANGGINTSYGWGNYRAPNGGPFGGGFAGVDLQQGFLSIGYARRFHTPVGQISIGIAPTVAVQMINFQGLKTFAPYSTNPWELSDMAYDWSYGGGVRVGLDWGITDRLRFGWAASTPMWMTSFDKYSGLLAGYGNFNIPATMQAGLAFDLLPNLTLMTDWRHIFYSAVPSLGNPSNPITRNSLGAGQGPGFDWTDVDSAAVGAEWRYSPALTLRTRLSLQHQSAARAFGDRQYSLADHQSPSRRGRVQLRRDEKLLARPRLRLCVQERLLGSGVDTPATRPALRRAQSRRNHHALGAGLGD